MATPNEFKVGHRGASVLVTIAWSTGEKFTAMAKFNNEDVVDEVMGPFEEWCLHNPSHATKIPMVNFDGMPAKE